MRSIIAALSFLLLPSMTLANTDELDGKVMRATHFAREPMPPQDRKLLAEAALAFWRSFDARIPRNSPAAVEWLTKETSTTDTARIGRAIATPEYALWTLANTSSGCVKLFEHLNESLDGSSLRELYIWTKTLSCYKDPDDLLIYLQRAGLSNGGADGEFHMQHFSFYHDTVTGYIANAIEAEKHP